MIDTLSVCEQIKGIIIFMDFCKLIYTIFDDPKQRNRCFQILGRTVSYINQINKTKHFYPSFYFCTLHPLLL